MTSGSRDGSVIVGGARTPIGRLLGAFADVSAVELGGHAIAGALAAARVEPDRVDHVIMGQVLTAGAGQIPARQAAVRAGIGMDVPALTVNKVCLSGLAAVALADQLIRGGVCDLVVAGGMESMSRAPHLVDARRAHPYGDVTMIDHLAHDGLWDAWTEQPMGALTDAANRAVGGGPALVGRAEQDAFALRSHQRAARAAADGTFDDEIVPVSVPQRRGDPRQVTADEGIRPDTSLDALAKLRPAFGPDGTITAGSSSPISDGAAALVVTSPATAERLGLTPVAVVGGYGQVAGPDSTLQRQPSRAIRAAVERHGIGVDDLDLIEINEAFASVVLASVADLGLDPDRTEATVNVDGGAIALGHPIGASGARLVLHLARALRARGGGTGVAALCGGGGQGDALVLSTP